MWPSQGFENIEQAREWVKAFIDWYNFEHRHSAIKFVTPAQRHHGEDIAILQKRQAFYEQQRSENVSVRWTHLALRVGEKLRTVDTQHGSNSLTVLLSLIHI